MKQTLARTALVTSALLASLVIAERLLPSEEMRVIGRSRSVRLREFDPDGFMRPSAVHSRPDITIIFLGGSTTACLAVDEEKRFPYLAGRLLERRTGLAVNAYNSAETSACSSSYAELTTSSRCS